MLLLVCFALGYALLGSVTQVGRDAGGGLRSVRQRAWSAATRRVANMRAGGPRDVGWWLWLTGATVYYTSRTAVRGTRVVSRSVRTGWSAGWQRGKDRYDQRAARRSANWSAGQASRRGPVRTLADRWTKTWFRDRSATNASQGEPGPEPASTGEESWTGSGEPRCVVCGEPSLPFDELGTLAGVDGQLHRSHATDPNSPHWRAGRKERTECGVPDCGGHYGRVTPAGCPCGGVFLPTGSGAYHHDADGSVTIDTACTWFCGRTSADHETWDPPEAWAGDSDGAEHQVQTESAGAEPSGAESVMDLTHCSRCGTYVSEGHVCRGENGDRHSAGARNGPSNGNGTGVLIVASLTTGEAPNIEAARGALQALRAEAEQTVARVDQLSASLQSADLDSQTLGEVAEVLEAADGLKTAADKVFNGMQSRHGVMEEAVNSTPHAAKTDWYKH